VYGSFEHACAELLRGLGRVICPESARLAPSNCPLYRARPRTTSVPSPAAVAVQSTGRITAEGRRAVGCPIAEWAGVVSPEQVLKSVGGVGVLVFRAGRLSVRSILIRPQGPAAVTAGKPGMVRLRSHSRPRTMYLLVLVGTTLLPCCSAFWPSGMIAFGPGRGTALRPPLPAGQAGPSATCRPLPGPSFSYGGDTILRASTGARGWSSVRRSSPSLSMVAIEPIEEMRDYRDDDLSGRRLFVTGLPSSIDDVRLYLAFEGFGRITEAHVAKPGLGFVVYDEVLDADGALEAMEGTEISGKEIKVISCARCCIAACARSPSFPGALLS